MTKPAIATMLVLAGAIACHHGPAGPQAASPIPAQGPWRAEPPMNFARAAHAVVSTGDAIWALAGTGAGGAPVLQVERFNGKKWVTETTLPGSGLNGPAAAVIGTRIYLIGGFNTTTNVPTDQVLIYDIARKRWSKAAHLPAPRGGHAAIAWDGKIHVLGGGNSRSTIGDHSVYDAARNSWSSAAPLPRAEGSPAAAVFGGKLYAIGGRSGPGDYGAVDIYDAGTNNWTAGPAIEPRGTAGAAVYCGSIFLFGGESQAKAASLAQVLRLDAGAPQWQAAPAMPTARNFARAVLFHDVVYIVGGSPTPGRSHASEGSSVVESFRLPCH